ncbi:16S rRNA (guanine(966)-N(2))-methyltransferase RsmD [uncultured Fibrobacter sp.]|uniref:16S rRNA (guanine(966)-N(2))-methyltransferase RsmD n=1 Tax=uncultured Fibrobacter sp. TaxID=261512 RepID=UPI002626D394|nr:16S rRNA (guanine(966)-N(2))-methyltransferase RsmD [uncultured Fibrobacter sp.]
MPIRITGGLMRGRNVPSPETSKTRPTASRTREALFNILQGVENFRMLDLFAGTGIMGIEAISRGAASVVAVEMAHAQARLVWQAYKALSIDSKLTLLEKNVLSLDKETLCREGGFDLIYADPPFKDMEYPDLRPFYEWLNPGGVAVFEAPSRKIPAWVQELDNVQVRRYGESSLVIYRR